MQKQPLKLTVLRKQIMYFLRLAAVAKEKQSSLTKFIKKVCKYMLKEDSI